MIRKSFMRKHVTGKCLRGITKAVAGICMAALLASCGSASRESADMAFSNAASSPSNKGGSSYAAENYYSDQLWSDGAMGSESYDDGTSGNNGSGQKASNPSTSQRKLIKTVNMNVETQEYETLMTNLENRVKELGGYIQNLDSYNGSNYGYNFSGSYKSGSTRRYANLTIRIPQQKLDDFVGSISDLANVVTRRESVEDVTLQYVDLQSHKESLQVEQKRLLALLERAETLEDIITLENRLTSVRYQIESMESSLRTFDDQVDYSTVQLRVDEVEVYTPVEVKEETAWERMVNGFLESLTDVRDGAVNFGIWFVVHIPYLVIWAIVITAIVMIIKKIRRGKKAKREKKKAVIQTDNEKSGAQEQGSEKPDPQQP